ncbi:phage baseplate plug protein [Levilactobacillus namurensis]|uniref:phage baseplate plug family protein n=1 Tax=Levilactobacillus namurensis TaxID=380393 RepID=UPI0036F3CBC4
MVVSQRDYIPVDVDDLPEIFEIELADITFNFGVSYNAVGDFFYGRFIRRGPQSHHFGREIGTQSSTMGLCQ